MTTRLEGAFPYEWLSQVLLLVIHVPGSGSVLFDCIRAHLQRLRQLSSCTLLTSYTAISRYMSCSIHSRDIPKSRIPPLTPAALLLSRQNNIAGSNKLKGLPKGMSAVQLLCFEALQQQICFGGGDAINKARRRKRGGSIEQQKKHMLLRHQTSTPSGAC